MKKLDLVAVVLLVVGGLNWGLVALARFDLVAAVFGMEFGETNALTRIVYGLVGLSAVYIATQLRAIPRRWATTSRTHAHTTAA
ncbi:DUF378 domain-containing protein [Kribbella sp. NPDC049174]|uniref:DUF378 domain-containing protein n=1 Tax=Kribbella sp. NPDC049174 TaxID=3364112 RepID=UPI003716977A